MKAIYEGKELERGDKIISFRGEPAWFVSATRVRTPLKSGKITVVWKEELLKETFIPSCEYYDHVFNVTVTD